MLGVPTFKLLRGDKNKKKNVIRYNLLLSYLLLNK